MEQQQSNSKRKRVCPKLNSDDENHVSKKTERETFVSVFGDQNVRKEIFYQLHPTVSWTIRTNRLWLLKTKTLSFDNRVFEDLLNHEDKSLWAHLIELFPEKFVSTHGFEFAIKIGSMELMEWIKGKLEECPIKVLKIQWTSIFNLTVQKSTPSVLNWFKNLPFKSGMGSSILSVSSRTLEIAVEHQKYDNLLWLLNNTEIFPSKHCWDLAETDFKMKCLLLQKFDQPTDRDRIVVGSPILYNL